MKVREILKDFNSWSYQFRYEILIIYFEDIKCSESKISVHPSFHGTLAVLIPFDYHPRNILQEMAYCRKTRRNIVTLKFRFNISQTLEVHGWK